MQEQLARERMLARRRKGNKSHDLQTEEEVEVPVDVENLPALRVITNFCNQYSSVMPNINQFFLLLVASTTEYTSL